MNNNMKSNCGCGCGGDTVAPNLSAIDPFQQTDPSLQTDQIEDGFDGETHGGGKLESVPGFNTYNALIQGLGTTEASALPSNYQHMADAAVAHYQNGNRAESVCGQDDRIQITDVTAPPWRMIAKLIITAANGEQYVGTGWFVSPCTVITAGHCVHSLQSGGWAQSIDVIPGMNGRVRPFGTATSSTFRSVPEWVESQEVAHDYGCIILPKSQPLGEKTGWFGFANYGDQKLKNMLINTSGYPADKSMGTQWFNGGRLTSVQPDRLLYLTDTFGGQSGSSVWCNDALTGKRHAVGIHNYGGCDNKSTRINAEVFDVLKSWKDLGM